MNVTNRVMTAGLDAMLLTVPADFSGPEAL
jgi:hypothetical protein